MRFLPLLIASLPLLSLAADKPALTADTAHSSTELIRTLHEGSNFKPYTDKASWQKRATYLREQVLISAGLWPTPEKCPLNTVIHGRIDRDDYTIEKVYFESYPGFFVTGNLYRPKGKAGPFPAVLSPHGHWENGRLYEASDSEVKRQLAGGLEKEPDAARYPLQARCANLARLGCIVFFYDMIGFADADPEHFPHRNTYRDLDSDLHGLSIFGLQTWDSIRSLDFLESLPDVDKTRIAITGASGGGTQSFMMMAIDDRLACAAPVNMISAGEHQGGCVCENNALLRLGTDNVELAATFAPKPFIHPTATGDWTKDYLEKGFPEIQATYKLFGAESNVETMRQTAPHNYNVHAREAVYNFFNKHLKLGHEGVITEAKFTPVKPADLHVWDAEHPRPKNAVDAAGLKKWWVEMTVRQMESMKPGGLGDFNIAQALLRRAMVHLVGGPLEPASSLIFDNPEVSQHGGFKVSRSTFHSRNDSGSILVFSPNRIDGGKIANPKSSVILVLPRGSYEARSGDGTPNPLIARLVAENHEVIVPDFIDNRNGWMAATTRNLPVEFPACYNLTPFARRVRQIAFAIQAISTKSGASDLIGIGESGPVCLFARAMLAEQKISVVDRCMIDADYFKVDLIPKVDDGMYLPLVQRYGGLQTFGSIGDGDLRVFNWPADIEKQWLNNRYGGSPKGPNLFHSDKDARPEDIVHYLQR